MNLEPVKIIDKNAFYEYFHKVIVIGDGFVGKTGITNRFCKGQFQEDYKVTIGVNFSSQKVKFRNSTHAINLWDVAGQDQFKWLRKRYYGGAVGIILVYDVTNKLTFLDLPNWIAEFQSVTGPLPILIMANKIDLPLSSTQIDPRTGELYERQVSFELGKKYADSINARIIETSAKEDLNINLGIANLLEMIDLQENADVVKLDSYPTIEFGFDIIRDMLPAIDKLKLRGELKKLKQTIFLQNPFSIILGNITKWIENLPLMELDNDITSIFKDSLNIWNEYYNKTLPEGEAVASDFDYYNRKGILIA